MPAEDLSAGALSAGGRFDRIEAALVRIEAKLDHKVERSELDPLVNRLSMLESGETPLGRTLLGQFTNMQQTISDLTLHGSANAQEAITKIEALDAKVNALEANRVEQSAVFRANRDRHDRSYRTTTLLVSLASFMALATSVITAVLH